jgi:imidazolonepropionase
MRKQGGRLATPGLIDCHTHLIFAGSRVAEFEARQLGASYAEISRGGGGILSTVEATRRASREQLLDSARRRARALRDEGVTTLEIKSGYGLDFATERRMLRIARALAEDPGLHVQATYLGAHAVPPEFEGRSEDYIALVCEEVLPKLAAEGLIDAVDAFCEGIAFSPGQVERVFQRAVDLGLPVKLHADQLSDSGGAALAARFNALSADHLEFTREPGVRAMAAAGTVAVLLPGAFYTLGETQRPPVELLRRHRVPMAVATDCNPGSSPAVSLLLMMNMACRLFGLSPEEALAGTTREAAHALGLQGECGTIEPGKRADTVLWDILDPAELSYWLGGNPAATVAVRGIP